MYFFKNLSLDHDYYLLAPLSPNMSLFMVQYKLLHTNSLFCYDSKHLLMVYK